MTNLGTKTITPNPSIKNSIMKNSFNNKTKSKQKILKDINAQIEKMKGKLDVDFDYSNANFNEFDKHLLNQMVKN